MHDVDLQKLPVRFAMDRAGLVGADGPTHCGSFDVTYMACLPNMIVMAPSDEAELFHMVATAAAIDDRPSCFRYPRGNGVGVELPPGNKGIPLEVWLNLYSSCFLRRPCLFNRTVSEADIKYGRISNATSPRYCVSHVLCDFNRILNLGRKIFNHTYVVPFNM